MKTHYSLLDPLRFFAAFWVMNFHYRYVSGFIDNLNWYRYGNMGVQLFFIISGFVIVQSLQGKTLKEFATGRFIRLVPLFWILCTFTYILTLIIPGTRHLMLNDYLVNMTMFTDTIRGFSGINFGFIDPSYWTLTVELIFYIAVGIFTFFFSYKNIRYFLAVWFLLSLGAFIYNMDQNFYVTLGLVRHASYFIFGGSLALICAKQAQNAFEKYMDWGLFVLSALYSIYIHPRAIPAYVSVNPIDINLITGILIAFFVGTSALVYASKYVTNTKLIKALMILGGLSYPLYLLHQTIGNTIIPYVTNTYPISWNSFALCFEAFIIFIAYLVYVQDKKMRSWLKKKLEPVKIVK